MNATAILLTGSTRRLLKEFETQGIECGVVDGALNLITYQTKSGTWKQLKGMMSQDLPLFSKLICDDKWWSNRKFHEFGLPTPKTELHSDETTTAEFLKTSAKVVVKPRFGAHGHGVQLNLTTSEDVRAGVAEAHKFDLQVILQEQLSGQDLRILVIGGKINSVLERRPAQVIGDGTRTVGQLIEIENKRHERGSIGIDALIKINMPAVKNYLSAKIMESILAKDQVVRVVGPANQSLGGTVHDAVALITPEIETQVLKITKHLSMPIVGIDCLLTPKGHYFLELNASPGIGIHDDNFAGITSGCFRAYAKLLYEQ